MHTFTIHTDSACDIQPAMLAEWGVPFTSLTFRFDGEDAEYANGDMTAADFYAKMRAGGIAKTAAVNTENFRAAFENTLRAGKDVLYIGFSTGLSTTYNSARIAAEELRAAYPDRKIIAIDTLAASAGEGLLVYLAVKKQKSGASIEETAAYIEDSKLKISIWFTVDDLVYLKRGGRVSPTVAFVGNMLGIKPILHMDDAGHLINVSKVRGRKTAVATLADKYGELATNLDGEEIFISHGDCLQDAEELANLLHTRYGATVEVITDVGPVIGAHSGPGTLALFFVGAHR